MKTRIQLASHLWALCCVLCTDACGGARWLSQGLCWNVIFPVSRRLKICSPHPCALVSLCFVFSPQSLICHYYEWMSFCSDLSSIKNRRLCHCPWCITAPQTDSRWSRGSVRFWTLSVDHFPEMEGKENRIMYNLSVSMMRAVLTQSFSTHVSKHGAGHSQVPWLS